jgi:Patatin-like phospholipase
MTVFPLLQSAVANAHEWIGATLLILLQHFHDVVSLGESLWAFATNTLSQVVTSQTVVPLVAIFVLFWPIVLSFIMAFATASTWMFWLITSLLFGLVQLCYVTYQFIMIFCDLVGLSLMKTYSMIRNEILGLVDKSSKIGSSLSSTGSPPRISQRKLWKQSLAQTTTYEDFLKLRIAPRDVTLIQGYKPPRSNGMHPSSAAHAPNSRADAALPPQTAALQPSAEVAAKPSMGSVFTLTRSNSFQAILGHSTAASVALLSRLPRNRSYSGDIGREGDESRPSSPSSPPRLSITTEIDPVAVAELGDMIAHLLVTTTTRLKEARLAATMRTSSSSSVACTARRLAAAAAVDDVTAAVLGGKKGKSRDISCADAVNTVKFLVSSIVKRNHLQLDDFIVENAKAIAESGRYGLAAESRQLVRNYYDELERCLDCIADGPLTHVTPGSGLADTNGMGSLNMTQDPALIQSTLDEISDRMRLIRKMKQNMGRTALMLSGGGAQAMYHVGVVKALIESGTYDGLKVISGTSGGSITAAMCAIKTPAELLRDVCVPTVSTDYMLTGEQRRLNIRWFPTLMEMVSCAFGIRRLLDRKCAQL